MKRVLPLIALILWCGLSHAEEYVDGRLFTENEVSQWDGITAPSVSPANTGRIYYNSVSDTLKLSLNGGDYFDITTSSTGDSTYLRLDASNCPGAYETYFGDSADDRILLSEYDFGAGGHYPVIKFNSTGQPFGDYVGAFQDTLIIAGINSPSALVFSKSDASVITQITHDETSGALSYVSSGASPGLLIAGIVSAIGESEYSGNGAPGSTIDPVTISHHIVGDGAVNDGVSLNFSHRNTAGLLGTSYDASYITCLQIDNTPGSEDAEFHFGGYTAGASADWLVLNGTEVDFGSGTIGCGAIETNNYRNAAGSESLIWNAGEDWWEFSDDVRMTASAVIGTASTYLTFDTVTDPNDMMTGTYNRITSYSNADADNLIYMDKGIFLETSPTVYRPFDDTDEVDVCASFHEETSLSADPTGGDVNANAAIAVRAFRTGTIDGYDGTQMEINAVHYFGLENDAVYEGAEDLLIYNVSLASDLTINTDINSSLNDYVLYNAAQSVVLTDTMPAEDCNSLNYVAAALSLDIDTSLTSRTTGASLLTGLWISNISLAAIDEGAAYAIYDGTGYPWAMQSDNAYFKQGDAGDYSQYWDGTNEVLDPFTASGGGIQIKTGANTNILTDDLTIDLGALVPDLEITVPILECTAHSSDAETIPFPYALGVYDKLGVFDESDTDEADILFAKTDFSSAGTFGANLDAGYFFVDWDFNPDTDDEYSLGNMGDPLRWKYLYLSKAAYFRDTDIYVSSEDDGHLDLTANTQIDLNATTLATDKIIFTQTDGNEYIDSLADGYLDLGATTGIRLTSPLSRVTGDLYVGNNADADPAIVFDGDTNDGQITYDEDNDNITVSSPLIVPYLGSAPSTLVNGMIWMESDGLHIYYNGAEKTVAGS